MRHPARDLTPLARLAALLAVTLFVTACAPSGGGLSSSSGEGRAERLAQNGDYQAAAGEYITLATSATGAEQDRLKLLAVEQWLNAGDTARARNTFNTVNQPSVAEQRHLWQTNAATLMLYDGDTDAALEILETLSREPLTRKRRLRVDALRADAWIQNEDPARAVELMTQRESMLTSRRDIQSNREHLWQGLLISDPNVLRAGAELTLNENTRGWLTLGSLAASTGQQGIGWVNGAVRWRDTHPGHPAMSIIDDLDLPKELILDYPKQIALLLPLSGRTARAGPSRC